MLISRKKGPRQPLSLSLGDDALEQVQVFKYLGVLISSSLNWSPHINAVCSKARKLLGLLYRRFNGLMDPSCLVELYKTLIRPHLEYAAPVWSPHLAKDIANLEKIQKFALKICLNLWDTDYCNLLELTGLPTLESRRKYLRVATLHKIYHGQFYFPSGFLTPHRGRSNFSSPFSINHPFAKTNAYYFSFFPSTIGIWNKLPSWCHSSDSSSFELQD